MRNRLRSYISAHCPLRTAHCSILLSAVLLLPTAYLGCTDGTSDKQPSAADRALADPWNYGPKLAKPDTTPKKDNPSDSEGLKRDLNNVFNP